MKSINNLRLGTEIVGVRFEAVHRRRGLEMNDAFL